MWQARHVQARLAALYPQCEVTILGMTTQGDRILDKALDKIGGKGLFVKELEEALADGRADLAVSYDVWDINHPIISDAVERICLRCKRAGKAVGIFLSDTRELPQFLALGVSLLFNVLLLYWLLFLPRH